MTRLDQERQNKLEPVRVQKSINDLVQLGYEVFNVTDTSIQFEHDNEVITYFPYSGWATGKSIKDGRGLKNLLKQLANK